MAITLAFEVVQIAHLEPARDPRGPVKADLPDEELVETDGGDEERRADQEKVDVGQEQTDLVPDRERVLDDVTDRIDEQGGPVDECPEAGEEENGHGDIRQAE